MAARTLSHRYRNLMFYLYEQILHLYNSISFFLFACRACSRINRDHRLRTQTLKIIQDDLKNIYTVEIIITLFANY